MKGPRINRTRQHVITLTKIMGRLGRSRQMDLRQARSSPAMLEVSFQLSPRHQLA